MGKQSYIDPDSLYNLSSRRRMFWVCDIYARIIQSISVKVSITETKRNCSL